jgi:hypothetical protein
MSKGKYYPCGRPRSNKRQAQQYLRLAAKEFSAASLLSRRLRLEIDGSFEALAEAACLYAETHGYVTREWVEERLSSIVSGGNDL